jgi:hypothetical protein
MSDVSSAAVITLLTTRDVWSTRTYKRKHTHLSLGKYTLPCTIKKKPVLTQPGATYPQITKQNSYSPPPSNT